MRFVNFGGAVDNFKIQAGILCSLLLLTQSSLSAPSQEPVSGDRVVLEINSNVYTQRMVESYLILRGSLANDHAVGLVDVASESNWKSALEAFTNEMIVLQEAQRAGSFSPSTKTVDAAVQMADEALKRHPNAATRLAGLHLSTAQKNRIVSWILKVEGFRRSKERQGQDAALNSSSKEKASSKNEWIKELQDRSVVRVFEGAANYRPISPPAGEQK